MKERGRDRVVKFLHNIPTAKCNYMRKRSNCTKNSPIDKQKGTRSTRKTLYFLTYLFQ